MKLGIVGKPSVHELFVLEHFITFQSAQKKYTESEIIDIQTELDEKIKHTPPNRVLNADEMGITTNCSKTVGYCRVDEKMIKKVPDQRQLGMKKRKLNFDHDGTYLPCPICQTETKNWNCHILYLAGDSIYNLFQKVSTEYTIVKNLKNGIICPNPKCGAGFESDIDYIGASIKCPECELFKFYML